MLQQCIDRGRLRRDRVQTDDGNDPVKSAPHFVSFTCVRLLAHAAHLLVTTTQYKFGYISITFVCSFLPYTDEQQFAGQ